MNESEWVALGVAATLFCAYIAHRLGFIQISILKKEHELNVKGATPKIGTDVRIKDAIVGGIAHRYFIYTTIYNAGEFPASKLKGNWNLACSESVQDRSLPIWVEQLDRSRPYELEAQELRGNEILSKIRGLQQIKINVDIQFEYFGLSDDEPQQYKATYEYDYKDRQMKRI